MCPNCRAFITTNDRTCPYCEQTVGPRAIEARQPGEILGGLIPQAHFTTVLILLINAGLFAGTLFLARTMGETSGFVKFVADKTTDEILGAHMIGPNVSELIPEVVLAMEYRGSAEDIAITVHAHPTLSEAVKEAALAALGRAIHM